METGILPAAFGTLSAFVLASTALALAPGPDNLFVLTQSAVHGRRAGLLTTLGLCTGLVVHTAAVAVGIAALVAASTTAFTALKVAGAAYLAYLAWRAFRAEASAVSTAAASAMSARTFYLRGIVMNVTNPKVAIFFLAFLPQFTDPSRGPVTTQILMLGAVFMAVTLVVFGAIAWFAGSIGERLAASPRAQRILNRLAGVVFLALAVRLVIADR